MSGAQFRTLLVVAVLASTFLLELVDCEDRETKFSCLDANKDKNNRAWKYLEVLEGKIVNVPESKFNSTYKVGVCTNVLEGNANEFAGAIEMTQDNRTIIIGRYNDTELMSGSHWILLKYLDGESYDGACSNSSRQTAIMFVCNHDVQELDKARIIDENLGREKNCYHLFEIEHCIACISDGCNAFFHRYSPGTIILIAVFSLITAYLLFGWIFTRFVLRKRGWKQIPNAKFWQEIGHLQADGCNLVCRCGKRPEDDYHLISGDSSVHPPQPTDLLSDDEHMLPP